MHHAGRRGGRRVALRKESVDRNSWGRKAPKRPRVALRKESVDRNIGVAGLAGRFNWSLSARRAWIEMLIAVVISPTDAVALRKESVDRNWQESACLSSGQSRSPQGERG